MQSAYASFDSIADPRAGATVTLLAAAGVAAFGLILSPAPQPPPSRATALAPAPVERTAAAPVKIVGAAPRSES